MNFDETSELLMKYDKTMKKSGMIENIAKKYRNI